MRIFKNEMIIRGKSFPALFNVFGRVFFKRWPNTFKYNLLYALILKTSLKRQSKALRFIVYYFNVEIIAIISSNKGYSFSWKPFTFEYIKQILQVNFCLFFVHSMDEIFNAQFVSLFYSPFNVNSFMHLCKPIALFPPLARLVISLA